MLKMTFVSYPGDLLKLRSYGIAFLSSTVKSWG
jgi:hypothetical protein